MRSSSHLLIQIAKVDTQTRQLQPQSQPQQQQHRVGTLPMLDGFIIIAL